MTVYDLPHLNAALNATSFVCLSLGYYFIRNGRRQEHRKAMLTACFVSLAFFVSYGTYHFNAGSKLFPHTGLMRTVYLTILGTHTVMAAVNLPLVIVTVRHALKGEFGRHRKLARWTFPIWMYVSFTGVVVYLLLYHY